MCCLSVCVCVSLCLPVSVSVSVSVVPSSISLPSHVVDDMLVSLVKLLPQDRKCAGGKRLLQTDKVALGKVVQQDILDLSRSPSGR